MPREDKPRNKKHMLPPPTTETVEATQRWLERVFPEDCLSFLADHNGYEPDPAIVMSGGRVLERFLPVLSTEQAEEFLDPAEYSIELEQVTGNLDLRIIIGDQDIVSYVPIAELAFGDFICLDYTQPGPPTIVVWDHEQSTNENPVTHQTAATFTEFLQQTGLNHLT